MYVSANGLGARRGMGFTLLEDSPNVVRTAGDEYTLGMDPGGDYMGSAGKAGSYSLTQWLNVNAGKVAIGAAAFVGLILFAKAGR